MRSKLFVPGDRPELFAKALASEADAISIDLEDAVQAEHKSLARNVVSGFLRGRAPDDKTMVVRVNGLETVHFETDLDAVVWAGLDVVNVPKVESADVIRTAAAGLARREAERGLDRPVGLLATIESPTGLRCAHEIASADPRLVGLQVGLGDLFEPLGIRRSDAGAVLHVLLSVRLAAGEAGLPAYDGAFADVRDLDGFRREAEAAWRLGYAGKSCIHPSQIATANDVFRPTEDEIAHAVRVVDAWREAKAAGVGALMVDGRMIDLPFARRADAIVDIARRLGLLPAGGSTTPRDARHGGSA